MTGDPARPRECLDKRGRRIAFVASALQRERHHVEQNCGRVCEMRCFQQLREVGSVDRPADLALGLADSQTQTCRLVEGDEIDRAGRGGRRAIAGLLGHVLVQDRVPRRGERRKSVHSANAAAM